MQAVTRRRFRSFASDWQYLLKAVISRRKPAKPAVKQICSRIQQHLTYCGTKSNLENSWVHRLFSSSIAVGASGTYYYLPSGGLVGFLARLFIKGYPGEAMPPPEPPVLPTPSPPSISAPGLGSKPPPVLSCKKSRLRFDKTNAFRNTLSPCRGDGCVLI